MKVQQVLMENLQRLLERNTALGFPFAIYRLPNTEEVKVVVQNTAELYAPESLAAIAGEEGFIVAPFVQDEKSKTVFIRPDFTNFDFLKEEMPSEVKPFSIRRKVRTMSRKTFRLYVERAKQKIRKGKFEKVVTARAIKHKRPEGFNAINFFLKICNTYEWSFVSLVFIPQKGLWLGASPELLLHFSKGVFSTYSLAGTQAKEKRRKAKAHWGNKEKQEQEIVSKYIEQVVSAHPKVKLMLAGPETVEAGNIIHLRTTFTIENIPHFYWTELVEALHPTPAVAGFSKEKAIDFIADYERNNRAYYSGFLGPVNMNDQINLFVNLRCMEIQNKRLVLHVGCGITANSSSKKEWEETKLKSQTLLNLI